MRGLSLVGLLVALGVVGVLVANQLKSSSSGTGKSMPTETIDKANEAATTIENRSKQLQQNLNKGPK